MHLVFFPLVQIEKKKNEKNYHHGLDAGPLAFQFVRPRRCLTNPFRTLSLCFGVTGKTTGLISHNNFVKIIFVCIGYCDNALARSDLIFPSLKCKECGIICTHNFPFPKSSCRIWRTTVLGMFKDSAIILNVIWRSFLTKSATAAMFTSVRVNFGWPPLSSSSTSSFPSRNQEYHLKTFDQFTASFP